MTTLTLPKVERQWSFKERIIDLRLFLNQVESECLNFDFSNPSAADQYMFLMSMSPKVYRRLDDDFGELSRISSFLGDKIKDDLGRFVRKELLPYISRYDAPLNMQICEKPYGYAGDFEVAQYFYEDGFSGLSSYGKLIDRYTLTLPLARAHINRRLYFRKLIKKLLLRRPGRMTRISSFACGPAVEVFDILECESKTTLENVCFTLFDGERNLIKYLNHELHSLRNKRGIKANVNIVEANILNFLRKSELMRSFPKQNLIYCAGFIDYLTDRTVERLIRFLFDLLEKDGILILVNVDEDKKHSVYLEMIGQWFLNYRTPRDLLRLSKGLESAPWRKVLLDYETKKNLYLVIRK